jgi:CubicO group peptidase (beta-lactamase class C family)
MKRFLKITLLVLFSLFAILLVVWGAAHLFTGRSQLARAIVWMNSDVKDIQRFPYRVVSNFPEMFVFRQPTAEENAKYAPALETVTYTDSNGKKVTQKLADFMAQSGTAAFIVVKDDAVLYEGYFNGYERGSMVTSFSVAKSFVSALVGIAIAEGKIDSVEDPVTKYIPELLVKDPRFADIRIRHLLSMSSGIHYLDQGLPWSDDATTYYAPNLRQAALNTTIDNPPGQKFLYNNYNPLLLGLVLERATGVPVATYLQDKLWGRIGMEAPATWSIDSEQDGFEKMESGINGRAIDFVKFGRLYLNQGNWNGRQVIPAAWVEESTRRDKATDPADFYQYFWWLSRDASSPPHFYAAGKYGQYIFVYPEQKLIIARFGTREPQGVFPEVIENLAQQIGN